MLRKVTNQGSYDHKKFKGETNDLPSQTIPNQAMSLQDLVDKFTVSSEWPKLPLPEQFESNSPIPLTDIQKMDKVEQAELGIIISQEIAEQQRELKTLQQEIKIRQANAKLVKDTIVQTPSVAPDAKTPSVAPDANK